MPTFVLQMENRTEHDIVRDFFALHGSVSFRVVGDSLCVITFASVIEREQMNALLGELDKELPAWKIETSSSVPIDKEWRMFVFPRFYPGDKYELFYNENNPNNHKFEIRGVVDDTVVVMLTQKGNFRMEDIDWLNMNIGFGNMKKIEQY